VLLDRSPFPSDTVSTHGIARGGVVQLSRWGLLDEVHATGAPAVRDVLFRLGGGQDVRRIKRRAGVDHLVAPRRHALDAVLQDAAVRAGATLRTGVTVTGVRRRADGRVVGVDGRGPGGEPVTVEADIVIGADGVRSRMAGWLGAEVLHSSPSGTGTFYTYVADVPLETEGVAYEFHVARDAFAGIFPTNDGVACVWLGAPTRTLGMLHSPGPERVDGLLAAITAASPSLGARVRAGQVLAPVRGRADLPNVVRRPVGRLLPEGSGGSGRSGRSGRSSGGWALVGDAGYHRDPVTGHGITDAFRDAELLAGAVGTALRDPECEQEALTGYHVRRDAALREIFSITRDLSAFPEPERFVELQIQLSDALEREAEDLAALPFPAAAIAA
jgi:flavin-dependent dehydrogenase